MNLELEEIDLEQIDEHLNKMERDAQPRRDTIPLRRSC